jgi:signal transduction histidine kinase
MLSAWVPYAVLAVAVALTLLGTSYIMRTSQTQDVLEFRAAADETQHLIEARIQTYIELLRAGAAFFGASDFVTAEEFRAFIARLRLNERYPGIQGMGYAVRALPGQLRQIERRLAALGMADAGVWPPGRRAAYTVIMYLEPLDERNRAAIGYDMSTERSRREAMERARDTGEPSASQKLTLVQEIDDQKQPGFVIYVPVYRKDAPTTTVDERSAALVGYVYSPFRTDDLLQGILAPETDSQRALDFQVYDGAKPTPADLLHSSYDPARAGPDLARVTYRIDVAGRPWTLEFIHFQPFVSIRPWLAPLTFIGGLILSVALFGVTLAQFRAWETAARHAAELRISEEALRESEARLRRLVVLERDARDAAQAADRAKDEFLATISHELRTPLNAMLGWLSMLRTGKVREDRRVGALDVIERNARTQARLIEDLLDVSRIITGKVRIDLQPIQVGPIVQTVIEALRPGADAKGVQIHSTSTTAPTAVMGDSARVQQIVWNLLSNAIKFTPPGGHVYVEVAVASGHVHLQVRDTGVGITPEFLPHVFERFRQADASTTRAHSGVGLGLAIVRHLVELHGGHIDAQSDGTGRGSTFTVRFPVAARAQSPADPAPGPPSRGVPLDGIRVLVVDDDEDTRDMLLTSLTESGARVRTAASAADALHLLTEENVDVLVSDIGMPEVDGYELIGQIRTLPDERRRVPAIALTSYARPEDRARAFESGFQMHVPKPVELDALQRAVSTLAQSFMIHDS